MAMESFSRIFVILHLSLGSRIGLVAAEPLSDATCLDQQCKSDALDGPQEDSGHALLSTRSALHRTGAIGQSLLDQQGEPSLTHHKMASEFVELSKELEGKQMQKIVELMRTMYNENTQANKKDVAAPAHSLGGELSLLALNASQPVRGADDPPIFAPAPAAEAATIPEEKEPVNKTHVMAKFIVVPISAVFFIVYNISTVMEKLEITAIPESGVVIAIGVVLGFFMKKYSNLEFFENADAWAELNTMLLNLMLLPIIIFASGWALRRQDFFSQFPYILLFAVVGTGISTTVVAGLIHTTGGMGLHNVTRWRTAFAYASLISATDPVATLTTYSKLNVEPLLNIMVFGESTINDAVAIVLFKIFNGDDLMKDPATGEDLYFGPRLFGNILWGIMKTFFGSLFMGVGLGMAYTLIARGADMRTNKKGQILVIFVSCYLTYALAESVGLSGIIAEIFCSLVMGVYMRPHLSNEGCVLTTFFVKQISDLADCAVFLLVGVSVVQLTTKGWAFGLWVMLFCLIGRACSTVPIAVLVNGLKAGRGTAMGVPREGWNLLTPQHVFMMWHAGLRGGIALALAWELGPWVDIVEGPGIRYALQTATFLVILAFLAVFGGSTSYCLKHLGIPIGTDEPEDVLSKTEGTGSEHGFLKWFDKQVLVPVLIGEEEAKKSAAGDASPLESDVSWSGDAEEMMKKSMKLHRFATKG